MQPYQIPPHFLLPFLFIYFNKLGYKNLGYMTQFLSEYSQDLK